MSKRPIDLSSLPPDVRRLVEQQLAKLPPQAREKLLREGSPIIEKMLAKLQSGGGPPPLPAAVARAAQRVTSTGAHTASHSGPHVVRGPEKAPRATPRGHYNDTIRPGDGGGSGRWMALVLIAAVLVAFYWR